MKRREFKKVISLEDTIIEGTEEGLQIIDLVEGIVYWYPNGTRVTLTTSGRQLKNALKTNPDEPIKCETCNGSTSNPPLPSIMKTEQSEYDDPSEVNNDEEAKLEAEYRAEQVKKNLDDLDEGKPMDTHYFVPSEAPSSKNGYESFFSEGLPTQEAKKTPKMTKLEEMERRVRQVKELDLFLEAIEKAKKLATILEEID